MSRTSLIIPFAFAAATVLSGCGSSGGGSTGGTTGTVSTIALSGGQARIVPGEPLQFTAVAHDASGNVVANATITWSSSNTAVATVTSSGLVTAIATGTATITAASGSTTATFPVTVIEGAYLGPTGGTLTAANGAVTLVLPAGALAASAPLSATANTSPPANSGLVAGTAFDVASGSTFVAPATLTIHYNSTSVPTGFDPSRIRIDQLVNGSWTQVTGSTVNTTTNTATAQITSGGTFALIATATPVNSVTITASKTSLNPGDTVTYTATAQDANGNALAGRTVSWNSSQPGVATVSSTGVVTAIATGTTTITATSEGVSGNVTVTVSSATALVEQRVLAQQGLAIALASTVLQSQLYTLVQVIGGSSGCQTFPSGGSLQLLTTPGVIPARVGFYFDAACTRPYMIETVSQNDNPSQGNYHLLANAVYTGPTGTTLGNISFDETANNIGFSGNRLQGTVHGLGIWTPQQSGPTVQLGLNCDFSNPNHNVALCQGGIAQSFSGLSIATGSVSTLALDSTNAGVLNFSGSSVLTSGNVNALTLTAPSALSMVVTGGTTYGATNASGSAASFSLFPPTPTGWTVSDAAHDQVFNINVIDNTARNLTGTIKQISTGATLATFSLDQSGTGTITYSDGSSAAVTSWTLGR